MIPRSHGGDKIESTMTAATDAASRFVMTSNGVPDEQPKADPPQVLISPAHVAQMREKRRQIEALQTWAQSLSEVSR